MKDSLDLFRVLRTSSPVHITLEVTDRTLLTRCVTKGMTRAKRCWFLVVAATR